MTEGQDKLAMASRFRAAVIVAVAADALQLVIYPMFVGGALSPADDVLDVIVGGVLIGLLGWHCEFVPSFLGELVPGVDLVPFWTLAVANVYRKWKHGEAPVHETVLDHPSFKKLR